MAATQSDTLRLFTALSLLQEDWAGKLLLGIGLNNAGRTLALASLVAGAAALLLEADAIQLREATGEGCATFTVTTLDEALRALKNEIRQRRAITIALSGDTVSWLQEMVERGVLPHAIASSRAITDEECKAITALQRWGAIPLHGCGLHPFSGNGINLDSSLSIGSWTMVDDQAESLRDRQLRDASLREHIPNGLPPHIATRWLDTALSLFPRDRHRSYWTSAF